MIQQDTLAQQQELNIYKNDSVLLVNDPNMSMPTLASELIKVGYQVSIVEDINNIYEFASNYNLKFEPYKSHELFILINTQQLNKQSCHFIGATKLSFRENVHFIYYSEKDNLLSHLQGIRNHGEAFITSPIDCNELTESIKKISSIEQSQYRILFIDDDESIGIYYQKVFEKAGIHCQYESSIENILNLVTDYKPDLLLLDLNMPECSGIELSQMLRQRIDIEFIPIVYLSSESDPLIKFKLIKDGVDDFLEKSTSSKYIVDNLKNRLK